MKTQSGQERKSFWRRFFKNFVQAFRWDEDPATQNTPDLLENLESAQREWRYAKLYFNCVTDPDLIDHAIFHLGATERKYVYLLKCARETGLQIDDYQSNIKYHPG
ncbi:MAG TPA: DUF2508 family protein [Bacillota bacterium]